MGDIDLRRLREPFEPSEIEWRVGATNKDKLKGIALPYITNRAVQNRLDEVCGAGNVPRGMGLVSGGYDSKKRGSRESGNSGGSNGGKLRDIYALMFKVHHLLPDEVGRQTPRVLFEICTTSAVSIFRRAKAITPC